MLAARRAVGAPSALGRPATRPLAKLTASALKRHSLILGKAIPGQPADRILKVVETQHVKPGKGAAFTQAKLRCVQSNQGVQHKFRSSEHVETVDLDPEQTYQLLYTEGGAMHVMNMETFESDELPLSLLGEGLERWLADGMEVKVRRFEGRPLTATIPESVSVEVAQVDGASKGGKTDTRKGAMLANGVNMQVPHFVQVGDRIVVSTADGTYTGREG
jgi:elongation factor P